MSKQQKTQIIEKLTQRLSELKEQRSRLDAEARERAEKRNKLNRQLSSLRAEIVELKNERDELNEEVKGLKQQRNETKTSIHKKIGELSELNQEIRALTKRKPSKSLQALQEEVESIDWKIQTTSLSLQEEKKLVERVRELESQLNVHRKLGQLNQKILELQAELKALETKGKHYHEKLTETAQKSQEIHEKMLGKIDTSRKLKTEADSLHNLFLQVREGTKPLQEEIIKFSNRIKVLKEEIREEEEKEKKKIEETLRKKLEKQAREKMRRGEKLTWEEFQLLGEKGVSAQD